MPSEHSAKSGTGRRQPSGLDWNENPPVFTMGDLLACEAVKRRPGYIAFYPLAPPTRKVCGSAVLRFARTRLMCIILARGHVRR